MKNKYTYEDIYTKFIIFKFYREKDRWFSFFENINTGERLYYNQDNQFDDKVKQEIMDFIKHKILIGHGVKWGELGYFHKALLNGNPLEPKDPGFDFYQYYTYIDIAEFTPSLELFGACTGENINIEWSTDDELINIHSNLIRKAINYFKVDIEVKIGFNESDGVPIDKCLKSNTTKLTTNAIFNGDDSELEDEKFNPRPELKDYFLRYLPHKMVYLFMSYFWYEIKEMKLNKDLKSLFEYHLFNNKVIIGLGGEHSVHDIYNWFTSWSDKWKGWVLLHIDGDSYYPNHMIHQNTLSRKADKPKFTTYRDDRKRAKSDPSMSFLMVLILKIKINAMYGQSGNPKSKLYDPSKQLDTTAHGQLTMIAFAQKLHNLGGIIFQTNTDGLYVAVRKETLPQVKEACDEISKLTNMAYDQDEIELLYQANVNNYVKRYTNGKIEVKGMNLCGDYENKSISSKSYPIAHLAVYEYLINGIPIRNTIMNCDDLSMFIMTHNNANGRNMVYGQVTSDRVKNINDRGNHSSIYYDKIMKTGMKLKNLDVLHAFEKQTVVRTLPVLTQGGKIVFQDGNRLDTAPNQGKNNIILMGDLNDYDFNNYKNIIDYEFIINFAEKRIQCFK